MISLDFNLNYEVLAKIGEGHFAQVYLARSTPASLLYEKNDLVAIKRVVKNKIFKEAALAEINALLELREVEGVTQILQIYETNNSFHIIMDYVEGSCLYQYIRKFSKLDKNIGQKIFKQMVETVHKIHLKGFLHRDLKPQNILLILSVYDDPLVKIADFGLAEAISRDSN